MEHGRAVWLLTISLVVDVGFTELGTSLLLVGSTDGTRLEGLMVGRKATREGGLASFRSVIRVWGETVELLVSCAAVYPGAEPGFPVVLTSEDGARVWGETVERLVSCSALYPDAER